MSYPTTALPFYSSVQFYGQQQPPFGPQSLTITQEEFCHDTLVLQQAWADDVTSDSYVSGMPVSAAFGRTGAQRSFYGYVNHATRTNNALAIIGLTGRNSTTVTCVGASFWMKQEGTKTFTNMTASQVIEAIAAQFNLDTDVVPHNVVWPNLQMAGMTYWAFCVMLAKRIGYTFYCNGIQLVFKPRVTDPSNLSSLAAVYDYRGNPGGLPIFTPVLGVASPQGGQLLNRQAAGVNPSTKRQPVG